MKVCSRCKIEKELTEFFKRSDRTIGVMSSCKKCLFYCKKRVYKTVITISELSTEDGEIWKDIIDWPDYKISNKGRIYTYKKNRSKTGYYLKPKKQVGYLYVRLSNMGNSKFVRVHRLVAIAFIPNTRKLPQVNHLDGDKTNNRDWNLEWVDNRENKSHSSKLLKNTSSKYIGVVYIKNTRRWQSVIKVNKKNVYLGSYINEDHAGQAYKNALVKYGLTNKYA